MRLAVGVDVDVALVGSVAEVDALPAVGSGAERLRRPALLLVLVAALGREIAPIELVRIAGRLCSGCDHEQAAEYDRANRHG